MDPATAATLMGGAGTIGNLLGMNESMNMQKDTNEQNYDIAQQQMQFQEQMSNTAYQRSTADMEKAGLNPMMMFGSGAPASTPSGASANMVSPGGALQTGLAAVTGAMSKGMDTAIAIRGQNKDLDLKDSQIDQMDAQNENINQDTANKAAQQALIQNQQQSTAKDIEAKSMSNTIMSKTLEAQIKKANAEGNYAEVNQLMGIINAGASSASSLVNPLNFLKGK